MENSQRNREDIIKKLGNEIMEQTDTLKDIKTILLIFLGFGIIGVVGSLVIYFLT